ncbi:hypothetical protein KJ781_02830 [Patescibacteria group bacterium]|nr:hypothetical protein [Patescibacteria group bacterium]MBU1448969.1 hypothetical protein [Patescibacteria group bacterium]MBU2613619.1 hypothetical protein [Patescibacteria group bacterium]
MSSTNLPQILQEFGLDEKESGVYLASLELGPASVQRLAVKSRIKRTTVYLVAEALKEKGLLSGVQTHRSIEYVPIGPNRLIGILETRKAALQEAMPELMALTKGSATKPYVRFFEGKEGILVMLNDIIAGEGGEMLFLGSYSDVYVYASSAYYEKVFLPERLRRNIFMRALVFREPRSVAMRSHDKEEMRELRYLPSGMDMVASQYVYRDRIAYISPKQESMGLIVESRDLAAMERQKFELAWGACS